MAQVGGTVHPHQRVLFKVYYQSGHGGELQYDERNYNDFNTISAEGRLREYFVKE